MKKSEIALIVVVSIIVLIVSYTVGNLVFGDPGTSVTKIEYVSAIDSEVKDPSAEFFNYYAHNPTVEIYVGQCATGEVWNETILACEKAETSVDEDGNENPAENNDGENENPAED